MLRRKRSRLRADGPSPLVLHVSTNLAGMQEALSRIRRGWMYAIVIGATLVLLIFFAPNGLLTVFERFLRRSRA
mgnify:CR=1 FL=1